MESNMKRLISIVSACFAAVTLAAAENPQPQPPATQADSPLVQAARSTHRLGKKPAIVITNDTLHSKTGAAHITTTNQTLAPMISRSAPPAPTPEMVAAEEARKKKAVADADAALKKKQDAQHREGMERAASQTEQEADVLYEEDPTQTEHEMEKAAQPVTPQAPAPAPPPSGRKPSS
jgi:hypothetical protein